MPGERLQNGRVGSRIAWTEILGGGEGRRRHGWSPRVEVDGALVVVGGDDRRVLRIRARPLYLRHDPAGALLFGRCPPVALIATYIVRDSACSEHAGGHATEEAQREPACRALPRRNRHSTLPQQLSAAHEQQHQENPDSEQKTGGRKGPHRNEAEIGRHEGERHRCAPRKSRRAGNAQENDA